MTLWTIQAKKVVDMVKEKGIYNPDFSLSPKQHQDDYQRILDAYNCLNKTDIKGLIFCLAPEFTENTYNEFQSVDEIKALFSENSFITNSLACEPYNLFDKEHVLLKLDSQFYVKKYGNILPIAIDYWNHIMVMDGGSPELFELQKRFSVYADLDYETFEALMFESIRQGRYIRPIMPCRIDAKYNTMTEMHIPNILFDAILEIYEASELLS